METVLVSVLRAALGAHVPSRVIDVLAQLIPAAIEVVRDLRRLAATGAEKQAAAVQVLKEFIDDYLDGLPHWEDLSEERRDRILEGLVELTLWLIEVQELKDKRRHQGLIARAISHIQAKRNR